jgi:hypothetical protein
MEVTPEMRAAVYADDCKTQGHLLDYTYVFIIEDGEGYIPPGVPEDMIPHVRCMRCHRVWLLVEESAATYEEAETALFAKLKTADAKRIKGIREKRIIRKKERERREAEQQAQYLADLEAQAKQLAEEGNDNDSDS